MKLDLNSFFSRLLVTLAINICFVAGLANAATVTDVKKKKKTATIDAGTSSGFSKGISVCFSDSSGTKIGCAKISDATESTSTIKLTPKLVRKLKKGATADLQSGGTKTAAAGADPAPNRTNVKGLYVLTPVPPIQYNKISFSIPESSATAVESLWNIAEKSGMSFIGGALEMEFGVGTSMSLAFGFRYRMYRDFLAESDYGTTTEQETIYAETTMKSTTMGGWFDFYFAQFGSAPFFFRLGSGLDVDMAKLTLQADKLSETNATDPETIATAESSLNLVSLRLGLQMNLFFKPIGLVFGLHPIVPLAAMGSKYEDEITDSNSSKVTPLTASEDLKISIDHKKASFGLEVTTGLYVAF
jgi:hypothetical protein